MDPNTLTVLLSLIQLMRETSTAMADLQIAFAKARGEGRDLTPAEIDKFRAETVAARAKLLS